MAWEQHGLSKRHSNQNCNDVGMTPGVIRSVTSLCLWLGIPLQELHWGCRSIWCRHCAAHLNFEQLLQEVHDTRDPHYAAKEAGRVTAAILGLGPGCAASVGLFQQK
jgi:hypothetical protein